jgi:hypothetical protein
VCVYIYEKVLMHIYIFKHLYLFKLRFIYAYVWVYICTYIEMLRVCALSCMHICIYVYIMNNPGFIYIRISIFTCMITYVCRDVESVDHIMEKAHDLMTNPGMNLLFFLDPTARNNVHYCLYKKQDYLFYIIIG